MTLTAFALAMLLSYFAVPVIHAQSPLAPSENDETKAKLLIIELFFLFVGLIVAGILLILIWLSRRRKKAMSNK